MKQHRARDREKILYLLNSVAADYLPNIKVRFDDGLPRGAGGQSDLERKVIFLSPSQEIEAEAISLGPSYAYRIGNKYRQLRLKPNEIYFLTLLHEIGHFVLEERIPRNYRTLRNSIKEIMQASKSSDGLYLIEKRLKRKKGESESAWKLRIADFESWLSVGETITHHMKVEDWAIDEFERRRQEIKKGLARIGFEKKKKKLTSFNCSR